MLVLSALYLGCSSAETPYRRISLREARSSSTRRRYLERYSVDEKASALTRKQGTGIRDGFFEDPSDDVARLPFSGDRQGGSRRMVAARVRSQTSCRLADWLAGSVAGARIPDAGASVRKSGRADLSSHEGLIHPCEPVECRGSNPAVVRNRALWTHSKQQPWKRKFAARDFGHASPPMRAEKTQQTG
jgi:hypothetical protein